MSRWSYAACEAAMFAAMERDDRFAVTAELWDVYWEGDGFGKHGNGPFATQAQAEACLRAIGWPGRVERVRCTMEQRQLDRILSKAGDRGGTPQVAATDQAVPK